MRLTKYAPEYGKVVYTAKVPQCSVSLLTGNVDFKPPCLNEAQFFKIPATSITACTSASANISLAIPLYSRFEISSMNADICHDAIFEAQAL